MPRWIPLALAFTFGCADGGTDKSDTDAPSDTDLGTEDPLDTDDTVSVDDTDDTDDGVAADPDAIEGGSFEDGGLAPGAEAIETTTTVIDGWRFVVTTESLGASTATGTARPTTTSFGQVEPLAAPADGNAALALWLTGPTFPPILSAMFAPPQTQQVIGMISRDNLESAATETSYTITVAVGRPLDSTFTEARLYASVNAQQVEASLAVDDIPDGGWRDLSVTLDPDDLFAGQPIYFAMQIRHTFVEGGVDAASGFFDHVRVSRSAAAADPGIFKPK